MQWHFIPPDSPHFGGLWEAAVKSMKHHMRRLIANQALTFEEMTAVLTQIELCLNSQPLTPLSNDLGGVQILIRGHFLIGTSLRATPDQDVLDIKSSRLTHWQLVQRLWKI
jgi:hypothetical protein